MKEIINRKGNIKISLIKELVDKLSNYDIYQSLLSFRYDIYQTPSQRLSWWQKLTYQPAMIGYAVNHSDKKW